MTAKESERQVCPTCGGEGEIGFFQGESRFFVTREECPVCFGIGYVESEDIDKKPDKQD